MHFLITAYDSKDSDAPQRRQNVREQHLAGVKRLVKEGKHLFGAAILDDEGRMIGSLLVVDYPTKGALVSEWLDSEPYVLGQVWKDIEIKPCRVQDFFLDKDILV